MEKNPFQHMVGINMVNIELSSSNKVRVTQKLAEGFRTIQTFKHKCSNDCRYGECSRETELVTLVIDGKPQKWIRRKQALEMDRNKGTELVRRSTDSAKSLTLKETAQQLMQLLKVRMTDRPSIHSRLGEHDQKFHRYDAGHGERPPIEELWWARNRLST
ncbi:hypothetical protein ACH5RR_026123 [Cinchona calisaya]|uniref:Uncharacterized protein n=1 Tax=Cinchona calisaya TaxID=153742 RepID=A0ABD2Z1X7_9GENT